MSKLTSQQLQELYEDMDSSLRQQIYSWFKSLDKDNSGYLDPAEFYAARKAMQLEDEIQTEEQLRAYMSRFDADNNGQLDLYEFCYVLIDLMGGAVMSTVEDPAPPAEEVKSPEPDQKPGIQTLEEPPVAEAATFDMKRPDDDEPAAQPAAEPAAEPIAEPAAEPVEAGIPATMDEPAPESGFDDDSAQPPAEVAVETAETAEKAEPAPQDNAGDEPEFDF